MTLLDLLRSCSKESCESGKPTALDELRRVFSSDEWGVEADFNYYSERNISNLWNNELRKGIKNKLSSLGRTESSYQEWLGDIHFLNIGVYRKSLFERYRSNAGWRIILMSIPRAGSILVGLASHYQNAQNHNKLGAVSNLLYDIASEAIEGENDEFMYGRKVNPSDWDQNGLILRPITEIAGINIEDVAVEGAFLKDFRTTTLKKILASFIAVKVLPLDILNDQFYQELSHVSAVAKFLSSSVYPYQSLEEFEAFRALALQDMASAGTRLQLRKKSSTRSIVRIYYGPPGTGKTLSAVREAVKILDPAFDDKGNPTVSFERFNDYREECAFVTFHPSLQYEDLVESIRPEVVIPEDSLLSDSNSNEDDTTLADHGHLRYKVHEGLLLRMIRRALRNPGKEFVIVIDEINRGDVSRILGPLISTLDPDKRVGAEFPIGFELQYPRAEDLESRLFMPSNLHIIGTMNSSDRNIALVDHALRRRFTFMEVPPEPALLTSTPDTPSIDCSKLLSRINQRIEHLIDSDHCIGHGYFIGCSSNSIVIERLATKVLPLLREYFYGSEGLMLLVLGNAPGHRFNIFDIVEPETHFNKLFSIGQDVATSLGYRAHSTPRSLQIDPRFWNPMRLIPGPDDEAYAVNCIMKIYDEARIEEEYPVDLAKGTVHEAPPAM